MHSLCKKAVFALGISVGLQAQAQVALVTNKDYGYGSPVISSTGDACLDNANPAAPVSRTFTITVPNLTNATYTWAAYGGAQLVSSSGNTAVVKPVSVNGRYEAGALWVDYAGTDATVTAGGCGGGVTGRAYVNLYQKFNHTEQIFGNSCPVNGDKVAFAIKNMVSTTELNAVKVTSWDKYTWSYYTSTSTLPIPGSSMFGSPSFSTDNSALSATVSGIPALTDKIQVKVGQCNTTLVERPMGQKIVTPTIVMKNTSNSVITCPATTVTQVKLAISNISAYSGIAGVTYEWILNNPNFSFASGSTKNSQEPTINIANNEGEVYLKITTPLGSTYCTPDGGLITSYYIGRSLSGITITGTNCVNPGVYTYSVPNFNAPMNWATPGGFTINSGAGTYAITGTVANTFTTAAAGSTLSVSTVACPTGVASLVLKSKPATMPGPISGTACLPVGSVVDQTYSVAAADLNTGYVWTVPTGWIIKSGQNTNSIIATPNGTTSGNVTVYAKGVCANSNTLTKAINYNPTPVSGITNSVACITAGKTSTFTLSVNNPQAGHTYTWTMPTGWTASASTGNSITVTANGAEGLFTVGVTASNACTTATTYTNTYTVSAQNATLIENYDAPNDMYRLIAQKTDASFFSTGTTYTWYVENSATSITGQTSRVLNLSGSLTKTIYCDIVPVNSTCTIRVGKSTTHSQFRMMNEEATASNAPSLSLLPNPAELKTELEIKNLNGRVASVQLLSQATGAVAYSFVTTQSVNALNLDQLNSSVYVVRAYIDNEVYVTKLTLVR